MNDEPELPEVSDVDELPRRGADDAPLVERVRAGDPDAFGALYDRWFDRVTDLAYRILHDSDAAADVAQDTFLSAWRNLDGLRDSHAFGGWLLRIARNNALNRKRKDDRAQPVDSERLAVIERVQTRPEDRLVAATDPARIAEDGALAALLWDAAGALGERDCEVLDLSLRHGLEPAEIAEVIGIQRNAANQLVHRVKQRLGGAVSARVLWRDGTAACPELRAALVSADVEQFGAEAVRVIGKHAGGCAACSERQRTHLSPSAMFAAAPIMALPALKMKVAAALAAEGVPMGGSTAAGAGGGGDHGGPGGEDTSDGGTGDGRGRRGRGRRLLVGVAIIIAIVTGVVFLGASELHDDAKVAVEVVVRSSTTNGAVRSTTAPSTSSTTGASTSTTLRARTAPRAQTPGTVGVAGTTIPPATLPTTTTTVAVTTTTTIPATTTTLAPPTIRLTITPASVQRGYKMGAVRLTWTVVGAPAAHVAGRGVDIARVDGQIQLCPTAPVRGTCPENAGTYVYALDAMDGTGAVIAHREATLTITAPPPIP